jgi:Effector Associated Constant Component 1
MPTAAIRIDGTDDELRRLANWLRDEDALRGRVKLVDHPIAAGEMGGALDAVEVVLTSGTASALVTSLFTWLIQRRKNGKVRLKIRAGNRTVDLTCGSADDAQALIDSIKSILNPTD